MIRLFMNQLRLCDVTMTTSNIPPNIHVRKQLIHKLLTDYKPKSMEIGILGDVLSAESSCIGYSSMKKPLLIDQVLQMYQTQQLCNFAEQVQAQQIQAQQVQAQQIQAQQIQAQQIQTTNNNETPCQIYMVLPMNRLSELKTKVYGNIAINSALSDKFLREYTAYSLKDTKEILRDVFHKKVIPQKVKLNIACISHCDLEGKQPLDKIIQEVLYYNGLAGIDDICLYDTYGMLQFDDFKTIIDALLREKMDMTKINLRLHNFTYSQYSSRLQIHNEAIIKYAIKNHIYKLDIVQNDTNNNFNNVLTYTSLENNLEQDEYPALAFY